MTRSAILSYLPLFIISIVLVILKWDHLFLPFHWDEAWVYGPAVREMNEHGISLLPGTISEDLTRGHPLLFLFSASLWLRMTGDALFSLHLFALLISLLFLFVFYRYLLNQNGWVVASCVTVLLGSQPLFLGQSALLFPEMLIALFSLLCFISILKNKPVQIMVFGSLLVLTKETGLVILFAMFIWQSLIKIMIDKESPFTKSFLRGVILPFSLPVLIISVFFFAQYQICGYVLFPTHLHLLNLQYDDAFNVFTHIVTYLLDEQNRHYLLLGLIAFWLVPSKKEFPSIPLACIVLFFVFLKLLYGYWHTPHYIRLPLLVLITLVLFYLLIFRNFLNQSDSTRKVLAGSFIILLLYSVFSCFNFFTERYLMVCLPFLFLLVISLIDNFRWKLFLLPISAAVSIVFSVFFHQSYEKDGEDSMNYVNRVKAQQQLTDYCTKNVPRQATIYSSFLFVHTMGNHQAGYLTKNQSYLRIGKPQTKSPDYYIRSNFEKIDLKIDYPFHEKYELCARFKQGFTVIELYKKQTQSN